MSTLFSLIIHASIILGITLSYELIFCLAFKTVLEQFGVDSATALALGLVVWFVFWAALKLAGFIVMRTGGARLRDLTRRAQDGSPS